jgi:DNA-binding transcriptional regulator LsrR (DeoR family)
MEQIGYLNRNMIRELKKAGAVGDINSRFIDADGAVLNHPINNKVIGIELEHLRKIPNVVGIALGAHKADSILSALKGRYLSAFVTDEQTATELANRIR